MYEAPNPRDKTKTQDDVLNAAKDAVEEIAKPLKGQVLEVANEKKDAGADQLCLLAQAMQGASEAVKGDIPQFAGHMQRWSRSLEKTADDIRSRDLDELGQTMSDFAKRNPSLVFGGAIIAGLALSRFLKSAKTQSAPSEF